MNWRDEECLIADLFAPLSSGLPGAHGLTDDAACLAPPPGETFVISTDAVVAGLHLPASADPADVAWKALAVNVSDVVAKGARPLAYLSTLMLGEAADADWLTRFAQGLGIAQERFGLALAGGDTDRARGISAPDFHVAITMIATLPEGTFVGRAGAEPGDDLVLTDPVGAAALGLRLDTGGPEAAAWPLDAHERAELLAAYRRPRPVTELADVVRAHARAAIDISDGLVKDVTRLCGTSGVGARLDANAVPMPSCAARLVALEVIDTAALLTGGEDYCVVAAVAPENSRAFLDAARRAGARPAVIGRVQDLSYGFVVAAADGRELRFARTGYDHLAD